MGKISEYFSWEEVTSSPKALELGILNVPNMEVTKHCMITASQLDQIRAKVGAPIKISSWYRSEALNIAVRGSKTSAHVLGWAVDCTAKGLTPLQLCKFVAGMGIEFDQIIHEYGRWMHISFDPKKRGQLLTKFDGGYIEGLLTEEEYAKQVGPK